ncbi:hypothetical protein M758_6G185000 [Ceratodon purpureus]|nr:hypothetical protein M758_6G185000 [Ceratodon purpureus]
MDMEGDCNKSADALHDANLSVPIPGTAVSTSEYIRATDSMSSRSSDFASTSGSESSPTNFVSSRIQRLMQMRTEYASAVEFEINASKDHWSELSPSSDDEEEAESDLEAFQRLKTRWGTAFFKDYGDEELVVGEKIAEGAQAEIFNAIWTYRDGRKWNCVVKVFKQGYRLRDLEKQWPLGMLQNRPFGRGYWTANSSWILGATLLKNGRFAFHLMKYWGDLRKLIDCRMQLNQGQSPPFTDSEVGQIMLRICIGMQELHELGIIHRDLKSSNILIWDMGFDNSGQCLDDGRIFDPLHDDFACNVADFECSIGVVGTGYWRAPEILLALKTHDIRSHLFTEKSDVYSFAMTCYEVLTGCIPFESLGRSCYDVVIEGRRPELPDHVNPLMNTLLKRCWHGDACERPTFKDIVGKLKFIYPEPKCTS